MNIGDLKSGDRILLKVNKVFKPVPRRIGEGMVYETSTSRVSSPSVSFSECKAVVIDHTPLNNNAALKIHFISITNSSNTGIAHLNYYSILSIWLYEGETNIDTVVPEEISDARNDWPYAAYQLPPMNIYRKKVNLVW